MPIRPLVAAAALLGAFSTVSASPLYVGGNIGFSTLDCDRCTQDPAAGLKLIGGLYLRPYTIALEGGYAHLRSSGNGTQGDAKQDSLFVAGVLSYPISQKYLVSLRLGPSYNRLDTGGVKSGWKRDVYWGAGLNVWTSPNGTMRLDYDQFSRDRSGRLRDASLISLGYSYRF